MKRDQLVEKLVALVFKLSNELEAIEGANPNDLWPLYPDRTGTEQWGEAKSFAAEMVALVKEDKGDDMLSDHVIFAKLIYGAAAIRLQTKISDKDLDELARQGAKDLLDFKATRDVDVPIASLKLNDRPFTFGPVTFHPISVADKESDWWRWAQSTQRESIDTLVFSYARTNVRGDLHMALKNATTTVNEALLVIRGVGFPLEAQERHQFGILGEYLFGSSLPYRLGDPRETTHLEVKSRLATTISPTQFSYDLYRDILSNISPERLETLRSLVAHTGFAPTEDNMPARLVLGFRWLGEASKPDILAARFAKVAFAFESFVGGEANLESLPTRGITAALGERTAFLVATDRDTRKKTDQNIRGLYGKRSGIAHGRDAKVKPEDFERFGVLVRQVGFSLIDKLEHFKSIDDLQKWVTDQRYS